MIKYSKKDINKIKKWGMKTNPFVAIHDYSDLKAEKRWENKEHLKAYNRYWLRRKRWSENKNFVKYYTKASKPIDRKTWEYLKLRKSYYIMPLGWENIAKNGGNILDIGCGDGDVTQNLIDYIISYWKKNKLKGKKVSIYGLDVNKSRIENCKKLVKSKSNKIKTIFLVDDMAKRRFNRFKKNFFNYCLCTGVLEILSERHNDIFLHRISKIVSKGIYIEDLFETFPGGFPRDNLGYHLLKNKFHVKKRHVIFSEPFNKFKLSDPKKIWPINLDQNIWAEK